MGEDNARKQREQQAEDDLKRQSIEAQKATAEAIANASKPTEFQLDRQQKVLGYQDWLSGKKGPVDIRNMPEGGPALNLYEQARQSSDAGRIGRGLNTMGGNANPNFVASLEKQNQLNRDLSAAGALEGNVNQAIDANTAEGYNLSGMTNAQNMNIAQMQTGREQAGSDRYLNFLQRPRQPSFLKQLALTAMGGAAQMGAAYLTGGMSAAGKKA
jgi:hypothetical protein